MRELDTRQASEFDHDVAIDWLWQPYIPAGRITVLDGDPGLGKSFITIDLCARISAGRPLAAEPTRMQTAAHSGARRPRNVIICNCEDERAAVIVPRLKAAGADLKRVIFGERVCDPDSTNDPLRFLRLPQDKAILAAAAREFKPALIAIDPVVAFLDRTVRVNNDQSVRSALNCLNLIAEETGAAILLIRHLNKSGGTKALYRGGGSIGIVGLARSGLFVAKNPDDPAQTLLLHMKSNLAAAGPALAFRLNFSGAAGTVRWLGKSELSADQALCTANPLTPVERAMQFLRAELADKKEAAVQEILDDARKAGIGVKAVTRAASRLLVFKRQKFDGLTNHWYWSLRPPALDPFTEMMNQAKLLQGT